MQHTNNFIKVAAIANDNYQYSEQVKQEELEDIFSMLDLPANDDNEWFLFTEDDY